jgi:hypothetical protein
MQIFCGRPQDSRSHQQIRYNGILTLSATVARQQGFGGCWTDLKRVMSEYTFDLRALDQSNDPCTYLLQRYFTYMWS